MSKMKKALSRRSFLTRVVGAAAMTGSAGAITGCATSGGPGYTGITDRDAGRYANRAGYGRGGTRPPAGGQTSGRRGITDIDPRDPAGGGQGGRRGNCTDRDTNAGGYSADLAGRGRHC